jgi:hypothetical protein
VKHPQALVFGICLQVLIVSGLLPNAAQAGDAIIIGATPLQQRFLLALEKVNKKV